MPLEKLIDQISIKELNKLRKGLEARAFSINKEKNEQRQESLNISIGNDIRNIDIRIAEKKINEKAVKYKDIDKIINTEKETIPNIKKYFDNIETIRNTINGNVTLTKDSLQVLNLSAELAQSYILNSVIIKMPQFTTLNTYDLDDIIKEYHPLFNPPDFDYHLYGFSADSKTIITPMYRYIGNHSRLSLGKVLAKYTSIGLTIRKVSQFFNKTLSIKEEIEFTQKFTQNDINEFVTAHAINKMFIELSDQSRFGNIIYQIKMVFEIKQAQSPYEYYTQMNSILNNSKIHISGNDTVCFQTLRKILSGFDTFPYRIKKSQLKIRTEMDFSVSLPLVIISLLNGSLQELAGNLSREGAIVFCKVVGRCSATSLITELLNIKSACRDWFKFVYDNFKILSVIKYTSEGMPHKVDQIPFAGEYSRNTIEEDMKQWFLDNAGLPDFFISHINHVLTTAKKLGSTDDMVKCNANSEWIRHKFMETNILTNPSIFYKTSLVLEYVKSIEPKLLQVPSDADCLVTEYIKFGSVNIPTDRKFTPELERMRQMFNSTYEKYASQVLLNRKSNWESYFTVALTNKSGGIKSLDPKMNSFLKSVSHTRLINFTNSLPSFLNEDKFISTLKISTKCAIRFQIDRRSRTITIVPNNIQSAEIFLLYIFNNIKKTPESDMFVGKQIGDMRDAMLQLTHSGDLDTIKNNSDVKGMDTATYPILSDFIRILIIQLLMKYDKATTPYFCTGYNIRKLVKVMPDGVMIEEEKCIPSSAMHMARVLEMMRTLELYVPDDYFLLDFRSTYVTFMSGLFGTSSQHTTVLDLVVKVIKAE